MVTFMTRVAQDRWYDETRRRFEKDPEYWVEYLKQTFSEDVLSLMDKRGVNQAELARLLGVSRAYVTRLFRGTFNPTVETLIKVALALDARVELRLVPREKAGPRPARGEIQSRTGRRERVNEFVAADRPRGRG